MANIFVSAVSTFDNKGLRKGQKEISAFDKSLKKLAKTFAVTFGAAAILKFSKTAINAFMKDEAAAKSLAVQLQNMGFGFATTEVERYIASLEKSTGVLDDNLRPALQTLITATGSLTQSQRGLTLALDISAATGKSVQEVSTALAKGFSGQTTALSRLGAGIDKATLKTGDMNKIMVLLENKFKGQALARLDTYAGKMDLLQGAAARASETIGKDLLDSISVLSGENGVQGAADSMENFATYIGNAVYGLSILIAQTKELAGINKDKDSFLNKFLEFQLTGGVIGLAVKGLSNKGAAAKAGQTQANVGGYGGIPTAMEQIRMKEWYAIKNAVALRKQENDLLKRKTAVDQLKEKFDLERIGIQAALLAATDEETKLRLKAQLAILDNNEAQAKKLLAEMEAAEALKKLAEQAAAAGKSITEFALIQVRSLINRINAQIEAINMEFGMPKTTSAPSGPGNGPNIAGSALDSASKFTQTNPLAGTYYGETGRDMPSYLASSNVTVNIDATSMVDSDRMVDVVQNAFLTIQRQGGSTVPAGAY